MFFFLTMVLLPQDFQNFLDKKIIWKIYFFPTIYLKQFWLYRAQFVGEQTMSDTVSSTTFYLDLDWKSFKLLFPLFMIDAQSSLQWFLSKNRLRVALSVFLSIYWIHFWLSVYCQFRLHVQTRTLFFLYFAR